jgi:hypothetical protein
VPSDRDEEGGDAPKQKGGAFGAFGLSDMMKKAAFAAIGAAFMTEESVRSYVAESKLPRELAKAVLQNANQAKEQFFGYLAKEFTALVKKSDLPKVAEKFLREHTIEVEAKIRFRPNAAPEITLGGVRAASGGGEPAAGGAAPGGAGLPGPAAGGAAGPAAPANGLPAGRSAPPPPPPAPASDTPEIFPIG